MEQIRILAPTAILGYGFPAESFRRGLEYKPHAIAVDGGSVDPGPYYLGAGVPFVDRSAVKRDLELILAAGKENSIPVIIGTAGGSGATPHLDWCLDIIREIARENQLHFRMAVINTELEPEFLKQEAAGKKIKPLGPVTPLTAKEIETTTHIVAQIGVEPFIQALQSGVELIVAGRSYDPAVFAALPIMKGFDAGLALHMGKILECASIAATPGSGSDCMLGVLRKGSFSLVPLNPCRRCTVSSVAAHTLYEKTNPYLLPGPGGLLDLRDCRFFQETENTVRVEGSRFVPGPEYMIKLEGAKHVGYRALSIAGARDPFFIAELDNIIQGIRKNLEDNFKTINRDCYCLNFHVYGRDGVMGELEPMLQVAHEIGIVIEAVARSQELASTVVSYVRSTMLHYGYPGRVSTAGNLAFPYSPSDFSTGSVYEFSVHHLLHCDDPVAMFPITWEQI